MQSINAQMRSTKESFNEPRSPKCIFIFLELYHMYWIENLLIINYMKYKIHDVIISWFKKILLDFAFS